MIGLISLLIVGQAGAKPNYFPMIPGSVWKYKLNDSSDFQMRAGEPKADPDLQGQDETEFRLYTNGELTGKLGYEVKNNGLYIVSGSDGLPVPPRKVMVFSPNANWKYYLDMNTVLNSPAASVVSSTADGGIQSWLGKPHQTLVCTSVMRLGDGKTLEITQTSKYADGIGLVEFTQKGHQGNSKLDTSQVIVSYVPGKDK